jgi:uncharacterized protein YciI
MKLSFGFLVVLMLMLVSLQKTRAQDTSNDGKAVTEEKQYEMKQYWMVFLKRGPNRTQDLATAAAIQQGHMANIGRLASLGKILVAGPFGDDGDLRGIFIMDCKDEAEVKELCSSDPAVKAGRLAVEIHPWWTAKGGSFK